MWDTLRRIYEVPTKMEKVFICIQENETPSTSEWWLSNIGINLINFASNKYLRFKNWYQKHDSVLDFEDRKVFDESKEISNQKEIIMKFG